MACCSTCCIIDATVSIADGALVLTIPDNNYINGQVVRIGVNGGTVASQVPPVPVKIGLGTSDNLVDIILADGNFLYSDQLYRRSVLTVKVATDSISFIKVGLSKCTSHIFPEPLTVAAAANSADSEG